MARLLSFLLLAVLVCAGCGDDESAHPGADAEQARSTAVPDQAVCRNLTHEDVKRPYNASPLVECTEPHNAETYVTGQLPDEFDEAEPTDPDLAEWAYHQCSKELERHLSATTSVLMRSMLSWVWFSPSDTAWDNGARWYRCDVIGGGQAGGDYIDLPTTTKNLFRREIDDRWMVCARGRTVNGEKVPCSEPHQWRAVTTIKVGEASDDYPGEDVVQTTTKSYCADSVDAWLKYPADYEYGYTWFGQEEWDMGNRHSVCWARTDS